MSQKLKSDPIIKMASPPLGEIMRSDSLLEELQAALLLPNPENSSLEHFQAFVTNPASPQQLLGSPLIGSEASNLNRSFQSLHFNFK